MTPDRYQEIASRFGSLEIAVCGDLCLDRYLEIDPARAEVSIETSLAVHNVVRVRSQPGGAGTILNNLVALGIGRIHVLSFAGEDGEGYELTAALRRLRNVRLESLILTPERRTFTYTKPLRCETGKAPVELNRLDFKNWTPTPPRTVSQIIDRLRQLAPTLNAVIFLEQVDLADTGVLTREVLRAAGQISREHPCLLMIGDSRRGLGHFPPMTFKMNRDELARLTGSPKAPVLSEAKAQASQLARHNGRPVYVTLSEEGILGASVSGEVSHVSALPTRGGIDIVGAGDAVTANLCAALAAGAQIPEAIELANAAASVVIHQLGTTGTATPDDIRPLIVHY